MRTFRWPTTKTSASGVVSIALAVIGSVVCIASTSELLFPRFHDQIEVIEDDLAHLAAQARGEIVGPRLFDLVKIGPKSVFAFRVPLAAVDVHGLVAFIHVEKDPPVLNQKDGWHAAPIFSSSVISIV